MFFFIRVGVVMMSLHIKVRNFQNLAVKKTKTTTTKKLNPIKKLATDINGHILRNYKKA
jgi:sensor domain CHASE-containing protein